VAVWSQVSWDRIEAELVSQAYAIMPNIFDPNQEVVGAEVGDLCRRASGRKEKKMATDLEKYLYALQEVVLELNPILKQHNLSPIVLKNKHITIGEKEVIVNVPLVMTLTFPRAELEKRVAETQSRSQ